MGQVIVVRSRVHHSMKDTVQGRVSAAGKQIVTRRKGVRTIWTNQRAPQLWIPEYSRSGILRF